MIPTIKDVQIPLDTRGASCAWLSWRVDRLLFGLEVSPGLPDGGTGLQLALALGLVTVGVDLRLGVFATGVALGIVVMALCTVTLFVVAAVVVGTPALLGLR